MTVTGRRCICSTTYAKNRPHSSEGVIETSDHVLTAFLLLHLWKATDDLPISADSHTNWHILINRVTPINVSHTDIKRSLTRLKSKEACGQDLVSPKLLKLAGETITHQISLYSKLLVIQSQLLVGLLTFLPWLRRRTMKHEQNYRQISPLCISGKKHMETAVSCTIIFHISAHNLVNPINL